MNPPRLHLLPAVDIAGGRAVQLQQGVAGSGWTFGEPWDAARRWQDGGAEWIHLVDLDAAFGRGHNRELVAQIVGRLDLQVELSGGIRDAESLDFALGTGCRRVNVGTAALEDPEWTARAIAEHGDRVAVGLDVRGTTLAARGWTTEGGDVWETLARLDSEGCARYVVTDVAKDGMLPDPTSGCCKRSAHAPTVRWSPPAGSRPSPTSRRSATWCRSGSRARSSDPRSTRARSRSPKPST